MRLQPGAGWPLSLMLGLCLVAACSAPELSPEEQRVREIESHCRAVAEIERANQSSHGGEQIDSLDSDDEVWEQAPEDSEESARYEAAYAQCMKRIQAE